MRGNVLSFQKINFYAGLFCVLLLAIAYYMEYVMGLIPCPLCMLQRFIVMALSIVFFTGIFVRKPKAMLFQSVFADIMATLGILAAGRQVWLQHLPVDQVPACVPDFHYLIDNFPLIDVLKLMIRGSGDCSKVQWTFLSLSIPEWTLIFFIGFTILASVQIVRVLKNTSPTDTV